MIYTHSIGRALQYFPQHTALLRDGQDVPFPDEKWGELVAAAVILRPGTTLSVEQLTLHCQKRIASFKVPRHIDFMTGELPKSGSGKILKRVLRENYWSGESRRI